MDNKKVRVKIVSITFEPQVNLIFPYIRKLCLGERNMILYLDFWQLISSGI